MTIIISAMKIDNGTLKKMEEDIKVVLNYLDLTPASLNVNDLNNVWFKTWCNRTYSDNNPNVIKDKNGKRILSFIDRDNYDLYPCNTNDTTIYTALNKILTNLK
jgi:hypothetical protein